MWLAAHATCGAALGKYIRRPTALAAVAVGSHVVLDWIPHWDYPAWPVLAGMDLVLAVGLVALLCRPDRYAWWGAFWAAVPDVDVVLSYYGLIPESLFPSHRAGFPHGEADALAGSVLQVLFIVLCVYLARRGNGRASRPPCGAASGDAPDRFDSNGGSAGATPAGCSFRRGCSGHRQHGQPTASADL